MPQIQDVHVHIVPEAVADLCQLTSRTVSCLLLLPWCIAITGYQIIAIIVMACNNQLLATDK